jgi:hypothetical protein
VAVKVPSSSSIEPSTSSFSATSSTAPTRKRLHRSAAATVKSYVYAQSDSDDGSPTLGTTSDSSRGGGARTVESNLQLWIKHLSMLQKDEIKKVLYSLCAFRYGAKPSKTYLSASSTRRNGISNSPVFLVPNLVPSRYVVTFFTCPFYC